jgi:putative cell wall-binding protein
LAGLNRYDTDRVINEKTFTCTGLPTANRFAIIARGDAFPDALAGAFLAGQRNAPILLTQTDAIPPETTATLKALGINQVYLLGLQSAISTAVETQLKSTQAFDCSGVPAQTAGGAPLNITVQRVGGTNRYQTARMVAETVGLTGAGTLAPNGGTGTPVKTAILASGENFPDALAAGPMAYQGTAGLNGSGGFPLLLTSQATLSPDAQQGLTDLGIKQVIIPGGTAAVSDAVATAVAAANGGINVIRFAGATRTDTAAKIAAFETSAPAVGPPAVNGLKYQLTTISLARGDDFADALGGGPRAGINLTPILLTSNPADLGAPTAAYLKANNAINRSGGLTTLDIFGGTAAITDATFQAAAAALSGP